MKKNSVKKKKEDLEQSTILISIHNMMHSFENRFDLIENRFDLMENRFELMENRFDTIENRFDTIEEHFKDLNHKLTMVNQSTTMNPEFNFTKIEDKLDYLNNKIPNIKTNVFSYLKDKCIITKEMVKNIINNTNNILNTITDILISINENNEKYLFIFAFQKSVIYYWNHEKQTWDKLTQTELIKILEVIQLKIIEIYNEIVTENIDNDEIDFIEIGEFIYVDFNKKYNDTKKMLVQKLK